MPTSPVTAPSCAPRRILAAIAAAGQKALGGDRGQPQGAPYISKSDSRGPVPGHLQSGTKAKSARCKRRCRRRDRRGCGNWLSSRPPGQGNSPHPRGVRKDVGASAPLRGAEQDGKPSPLQGVAGIPVLGA